jgi:hypothetical protein
MSGFQLNGDDLDDIFERNFTINGTGTENIYITYNTNSINANFKVSNNSTFNRYLAIDSNLANYGVKRSTSSNYLIANSDLNNSYVGKNKMYFAVIRVASSNVSIELQGWIKHNTKLETYKENNAFFLHYNSKNINQVIIACGTNGTRGSYISDFSDAGGSGGSAGTSSESSHNGGKVYSGSDGGNNTRKQSAVRGSVGGSGGSSSGGSGGDGNSDGAGGGAGTEYSGGTGGNGSDAWGTAAKGGNGGDGYYGGGGGEGGGNPNGDNNDNYGGGGGGGGSSFHMVGDGRNSTLTDYVFHDLQLTTNGKTSGIAVIDSERTASIFSITLFNSSTTGTTLTTNGTNSSLHVGVDSAWVP